MLIYVGYISRLMEAFAQKLYSGQPGSIMAEGL
jgi:hypothetical protein